MVVLSHPVMVQRQATAGRQRGAAGPRHCGAQPPRDGRRQATAGRQRGAAGTGMVVLSHHVMVERQAGAG
jgi:hypothetical protein